MRSLPAKSTKLSRPRCSRERPDEDSEEEGLVGAQETLENPGPLISILEYLPVLSSITVYSRD